MEYVKDINLNPLFEYKILCINNKHIYNTNCIYGRHIHIHMGLYLEVIYITANATYGKEMIY